MEKVWTEETITEEMCEHDDTPLGYRIPQYKLDMSQYKLDMMRYVLRLYDSAVSFSLSSHPHFVV